MRSEVERVIAAARTVAHGIESWRIGQVMHMPDLGDAVLETALAVGLLSLIVGHASNPDDQELEHTIATLRQTMHALQMSIEHCTTRERTPGK